MYIYIFSRPYYWKNHPEKPLFPIPSIHGSTEYKQNKPILTEAEFILHHVSKFWGCKFTFNLPSNIVVAPKITWNTARKKMKICSWCNALTDITGTFPCHDIQYEKYVLRFHPKANTRKYISLIVPLDILLPDYQQIKICDRAIEVVCDGHLHRPFRESYVQQQEQHVFLS